jgi:hypothetical protein
MDNLVGRAVVTQGAFQIVVASSHSRSWSRHPEGSDVSQVVWFKVTLKCLTTSAEIERDRVDLYTSALSPVLEDIGLEVGDAVDISLEDFEDALAPTRPSRDPEP